MNAQQPPSDTGIPPLAFAIGIAVLLVGLIVNPLVIAPLGGLIVNPLVIAPLGGAITLIAVAAWIRRDHLWLEGRSRFSHVDGTGAQARIHAFASKGAGEPASGPESQLYPFDPS
jgi:hypothetical protein